MCIEPFNTATFGGNLPGASRAWPEAGYTERGRIAKAHENYHRGLLHFLATDPRQDLGTAATTSASEDDADPDRPDDPDDPDDQDACFHCSTTGVFPP